MRGMGLVLTVLMITFLAGCVSTSPQQGVETLAQSSSTAWSLDAASSEPAVSVSPAQRSLRIAGSAGNVIGTSITAVANDRYRRMVLDALGEYDPGAQFEAYLVENLTEHVGDNRVAPLGSIAGYHSRRDAVAARYSRIADLGHDALLDVKMTHGLYGPRAIMAVSLENLMVTLPGGSRRYAREIVAVPGPLLANGANQNPMGGIMPDFGENLISVEEGAVERWLENGADPYKVTFEQLVYDVTAALLTQLDQVEDARGQYTLGRQALRDGEPEEAVTHFDGALELDPQFTEAASARAVALAEAGRLDQAIAAAEGVLVDAPEYGAAHFNLAWWHAVERGEVEPARVHYAKAQELGMPAAKKIDKALD